MFLAMFLTSFSLALSVVASPTVQIRDSLITLPVSRHINMTGIHDLVRHDIRRAQILKARGSAAAGGPLTFHEEVVINEPLDRQVVIYVASVGVGSPAATYKLAVDTGSSNTWVGAQKKYVRTGTSVQTKDTVSVKYGSASFSGIEFTDSVTLGSVVLPQQSIGVATKSTGIERFDGILGVGPVGLTRGTLSPSTNSLIPTITDNLFSRKLIDANQIGISFQPCNDLVCQNGELTWGGVDSSKFTGSVRFAPITNTAPASRYWGVNQSIRYGTTPILGTTAGIVDTGTTLFLIASDAFKRYQQATGAVMDSATGLLRITSAQYQALKSLFLTINGVTYEMTPNAQIWPRALNTAIGGSPNSIYLVFGDLKSPSGKGLDFICGKPFLERFYTVYDTTNRRVGFATTPFTNSTSN